MFEFTLNFLLIKIIFIRLFDLINIAKGMYLIFVGISHLLFQIVFQTSRGKNLLLLTCIFCLLIIKIKSF